MVVYFRSPVMLLQVTKMFNWSERHRTTPASMPAVVQCCPSVKQAGETSPVLELLKYFRAWVLTIVAYRTIVAYLVNYVRGRWEKNLINSKRKLWFSAVFFARQLSREGQKGRDPKRTRGDCAGIPCSLPFIAFYTKNTSNFPPWKNKSAWRSRVQFF
jgi:hypothetical protein